MRHVPFVALTWVIAFVLAWVVEALTAPPLAISVMLCVGIAYGFAALRVLLPEQQPAVVRPARVRGAKLRLVADHDVEPPAADAA